MGEADVLRAVLGIRGIKAFVEGELAANTLAHIGMGLNPGGIRILVRQSDLARAADALSDRLVATSVPEADSQHAADVPAGDGGQPPVLPYARPVPSDPDELARRACTCALYSLICPLFVLISGYHGIRALQARRRVAVRRPTRFALHLILAFTLMLPLIWAGAELGHWLLFGMLAGPVGGP